jgi:hypothetical protein
MAKTFVVFDFGSNEEAAQQARLTLERWKQSFRLGKKLSLKFDREQPGEAGEQDASETGSKKGAGKESESASDGEKQGGDTLMIVQLDFSDHEKLSHQRWLDRIPTDPAFKDAHPTVIRNGDAEFDSTAERFDRLE